VTITALVVDHEDHPDRPLTQLVRILLRPTSRTCGCHSSILVSKVGSTRGYQAESFLAWSRIDDEAEERNLDAFQGKQARTRRQQANDAIDLRITDAYQWALDPTQAGVGGAIGFEEVKLDSQGSIAQRVSRKLETEGSLQKQFPSAMLRVQLDGSLASRWADGDVAVATLWDDFARYLYLPRLRDIEVLVATAEQGPGSTSWHIDGFALAVGFDADRTRYLGLSAGSHPGTLSPQALVVKPEIALGQIEQDDAEARRHAAEGGDEVPVVMFVNDGDRGAGGGDPDESRGPVLPPGSMAPCASARTEW